MCILVIEDDAALNGILAKRLAEEGHSVDCCFDGRDGLDAPQIDDTSVSDATPWSSQHIVDMLCPPLNESGNPAVCYPVAGSKLGVTANWEPAQDGTGTPSPDNIRPIHGRDSVSVTRQEDELSMVLTLPSTIYGGEVNAVTGDGQETWQAKTFDGTEDWQVYDAGGIGQFFYTTKYTVDKEPLKSICSHFGTVRYAGTSIIRIYTDMFTDGDAWKAYLAAQHAAGTPIQVAYKLATPVPFTATGGGTIKALSGINTVLTDADTMIVTGRADPTHIIKQLQAASAASAQALADVERAVTDI